MGERNVVEFPSGRRSERAVECVVNLAFRDVGVDYSIAGVTKNREDWLTIAAALEAAAEKIRIDAARL